MGRATGAAGPLVVGGERVPHLPGLGGWGRGAARRGRSLAGWEKRGGRRGRGVGQEEQALGNPTALRSALA